MVDLNFSVHHIPQVSQAFKHDDSRAAQRGLFKFPDKNADRKESDYGADNFWKHKNIVLKNPLINNPPDLSTLSRT